MVCFFPIGRLRMAVYRVVVLPASGGVKIAGWAVEKSENDVRIAVVSQLYATRAGAAAEAERLNQMASQIAGARSLAPSRSSP
jgi:hypothetical protein